MIRTRFAPSPTGYLHIGGIRTALFNFAFAKNNNGKFYLRIEDTDLERSTQDAVDKIIQGMDWLSLIHDDEVVYQSKRIERHKEVIQELLAKDKAYYCYATKEELDEMRTDCEKKGIKPKYNGKWRPEEGKILPEIPVSIKPVVRFKNPKSGDVIWNDLVKGDIVVSNEELDDLILQRSDGTPTYNLCVVVDDMDMGITHVIRGDDHINNTPRQINIYRACDFKEPNFAHLSMILGEDGQKLSKRHGAASVTDYKEMGYLPESINNYLARLGWSHGDTEIFSLSELCEWFSFEKVTSSSSQFDFKKLNWINNHYLKNKSFEEIRELLSVDFHNKKLNENQLNLIFELYKDRCERLVDFENSASRILNPTVTFPDDLKEKYLNEESIKHIQQISKLINESTFDLQEVENIIKDYVKTNNLKFPMVAMPLRVILLGTDQSPSVGHIIAIMGKDIFNKRISGYL